MLCYPLFQLAAMAQSSSGASILSQGSITYPASNVNLAVISATSTAWSLTYGSGPQILSLDSSVTHNGDISIEDSPWVTGCPNDCREVDFNSPYPTVAPGDHIVASVWILVDNTTAYTNQYDGGRLGMDFYAHTSAGYGILFTEPTDANNGISTVTFGTVGWTQVSWDITVPSTYYTSVILPSSGNNPSSPCNPVQIDSICCWLDVRPSLGLGQTGTQGTVWFADAVLYINPIGIS